MADGCAEPGSCCWPAKVSNISTLSTRLCPAPCTKALINHCLCHLKTRSRSPNLAASLPVQPSQQEQARSLTSAESAVESADMAETLEVDRSIICALRLPMLNASAPRSLSVGDSDAAALSVDMPGVLRSAGEDGACTQQHMHAKSLPSSRLRSL